MLEQLFLKQRELLSHFYDTLDYKQIEGVFSALKKCQGVIFFTGVGKSGFVAQKVAASVLSTGSRACFLSAQDALHGDLGKVCKEDVVVFFSKSGETEELLALIAPIKNKGASTLALVSRPYSRLAKSVNRFATLPCDQELCPFDLAPTTSTEVQLLLGDVLAIALMEAKGFTPEEFAKNHPGGHIGRRLTLKVKDLMLPHKKMPLCSLESSLNEVMKDFSAKRCGCLIVIDHQKKLKGIFTDGDLRRSIEQKGEAVLQQKVEHLMTPEPRFISEDALATEAMSLMEADPQHPVMVLPVVKKEGEVVGLIKMHDIISAGL